MSHHFCRALVTVPGRHTVEQDELAEQMKTRLDGLPDPDQRGRLVGFVYAQSGIRSRHLELDPTGLDRRKDWIQVVNEATRVLAERTLAALRERDPEGVANADHFLVVTTSHVGFPSLSRTLQQSSGIPLDAVCYDVAGLGCAGPTHGLHLAWTMLREGRSVVLLFVDTMATWAACRSFDEVPPINEVVAHCLASDGAAALVLGAEPGPSPLYGAGRCTLRTQLWPDSLDQNDFNAGTAGRPFLSVGKDIRTRLVDETVGVFDAERRLEPMLLHPGGPDLMKRLGDAVPELGVPIRTSLGVLQQHGNLGSASVLFVLEQWLRDGGPLGPRFHMFALGPGIVTSLLTVEGAES